MQHLLAGQLIAVEGKPKFSHGLVKQPIPGGTACYLLVVQQPLDLFAQLVRAKLPNITQPRPIPSGSGRNEFGLVFGILDLVNLEREEQ